MEEQETLVATIEACQANPLGARLNPDIPIRLAPGVCLRSVARSKHQLRRHHYN